MRAQATGCEAPYGREGAMDHERFKSLLRVRIEDNYYLTGEDAANGAKDVYHYTNKAKGTLTIFKPNGEKLVEIYSFCHCRCIYRQDKTWVYHLKYEIFLPDAIQAYHIYPYMTKPQILITITSLGKTEKKIYDSQDEFIHILTSYDDNITLINNGTETEVAWVLIRKPQTICEGYDDIADPDVIKGIIEKTPGMPVDDQSDEIEQELLKTATDPVDF